MSTMINFDDSQSHNGYFASAYGASAGCHGDDVCLPNPCLFNSECIDQWNSHVCNCSEGWEVSVMYQLSSFLSSEVVAEVVVLWETACV